MNRTLAQIRAHNALEQKNQNHDFGGQDDGNALSGFPMVIKTDGLLPALAFAGEKGGGYANIANAISKHLSHQDIKITQAQNYTALATEISAGSSQLLRRATAEALAYLAYLKRYAKKEKKS